MTCSCNHNINNYLTCVYTLLRIVFTYTEKLLIKHHCDSKKLERKKCCIVILYLEVLRALLNLVCYLPDVSAHLNEVTDEDFNCVNRSIDFARKRGITKSFGRPYLLKLQYHKFLKICLSHFLL